MLNHATTELFFDEMEVTAENLIGVEGRGFGYILDGMNAERILIASECIGDARFFIDRASAYATEREVFGRPIGQNQGVQFPIARAYVQTTAAALMVDHAAALFEAGAPCGTEANMAKMTASEASWLRPTPRYRRTVASASPRTTTSSASSGKPGSTRWLRSRRT
jgi:alkylation response protein AidB-like acyl-CoA dehydrogenase